MREQCLINRRRMCRFFARGDCRKGVFCIWAHGEAELDQTPQLGHRPRNTKLCIHYESGWCGQGKACPYAHGKAELVANPKGRPPQPLGSAGGRLALPAPQQTGDGKKEGQVQERNGDVRLAGDLRLAREFRASLLPNPKKRAAPAAAPPPQRNRKATLVPGRQRLQSPRSRSRSASPPTRSPRREGPAPPSAAAGQEGAGLPKPATAAAGVKEAGGGGVAALRVRGCSHPETAHAVHGDYEVYGLNHGRPAFRSIDQGQGFDSFVYYWDDREGTDYAGWWIGPKLGGEDVWVHHPRWPADRWPPRSGWRAPHDGPVDPIMVVETVTAAEDLPALPDRQALDNTSSASASMQRPQEATARADEARLARLGRLAKQLKPQSDNAAQQAEQDAGPQGQLVALKRSLDAVHKETDEQMHRMMELQRSMQSLQQSMQDRQKREEQIQRRMRELVVSARAIET